MSRKNKKTTEVPPEEDNEERYDATYIRDVKHEGMDPIKYVDLKNAFAYVDVDKSGTLEISELKKELKKCKDEAAEMYPDLEIDDIIDMIVTKCDKNGDGKISFKEMVDVFTAKEITDLKDKDNTDAIYEEFCPDGGELDVKTLKAAAKELGEDPEECERMVFYADTDGDGIVSQEEFHAVLNMNEDELIERAKAWKEYQGGEETGSRKAKNHKTGRK